MDLPIRTYAVTVQGFPFVLVSARSAAKARARTFRQYQEVDDRCTFRQFLTISTVKRAEDPPGIGQRITVCGKPATRVLGWAPNGIYFMRDDSDEILSAHPLEVSE